MNVLHAILRSNPLKIIGGGDFPALNSIRGRRIIPPVSACFYDIGRIGRIGNIGSISRFTYNTYNTYNPYLLQQFVKLNDKTA